VVGSCGSGKTTVARRIARLLGGTSVHVDDYIWLPGWRLREREEMLDLLEERLRGPDWVMEGNLGRAAVRMWKIADRADLIVWLDFPLRVTIGRLVLRAFKRSCLRQTCCNGNRESLFRTFFSSQSILLYAWRTRGLRKVIYSKLLQHRPHVRLTSQRDVDSWLGALGIPLEEQAPLSSPSSDDHLPQS
jgi:adenylate kinase family enzyme